MEKKSSGTPPYRVLYQAVLSLGCDMARTSLEGLYEMIVCTQLTSHAKGSVRHTRNRLAPQQYDRYKHEAGFVLVTVRPVRNLTAVGHK